MKHDRITLAVLRSVVSVALLYVVLRRVDPARAREVLAAIPPTVVGVSLALLFAHQVLTALAFAAAMRRRGLDIPAVYSIYVFLLSHFPGMLLPGGLGVDATRALYFTSGGRDGKSVLRVLVSLKIAGILVLGSTGSIALGLSYRRMAGEAVSVMLGSYAAFALCAVAGLVMFRKVPFLHSLLWGGSSGGGGEAGTGSGREVGEPVAIGTLLLGAAAARILFSYSIAAAFGISLPPVFFFALVPLVAILSLVPVSVGGLGIRESAYIYLVPLMAGGTVSIESLTLFSLSHFFLSLSLLIAGFLLFVFVPHRLRRRAGA
jgi:hypothetical protein